MLTIARPPLMKPNSAEANAISRREMPDGFMMAPARMNSGMAISGKLVAPENMVMAALSRTSSPPGQHHGDHGHHTQRHADGHVDQNQGQQSPRT